MGVAFIGLGWLHCGQGWSHRSGTPSVPSAVVLQFSNCRGCWLGRAGLTSRKPHLVSVAASLWSDPGIERGQGAVGEEKKSGLALRK